MNKIRGVSIKILTELLHRTVVINTIKCRKYRSVYLLALSKDYRNVIVLKVIYRVGALLVYFHTFKNNFTAFREGNRYCANIHTLDLLGNIINILSTP